MKQNLNMDDNSNEANINSIIQAIEKGTGSVPEKAVIMRQRPFKYYPIKITEENRKASIRTLFN